MEGRQLSGWLEEGAVFPRLWCQTAYCRGNCHQQRDGFCIPLQNLLRAFEAHAGGVLMGEFVPTVTVAAGAGSAWLGKC